MPVEDIASQATGGKKLRVLVVDDSHDAANTMAKLLTAWGHEARTAYDGPAALNAALAFLPDVALVDLGLPGLDGYQVAVQLRKQAGARRLVLIAVTGYDWKDAPLRSREYGFDRHLNKPADPAELQKILGDLAAAVPDEPTR